MYASLKLKTRSSSGTQRTANQFDRIINNYMELKTIRNKCVGEINIKNL